jgi:FAD dependent oxidoreductase
MAPRVDPVVSDTEAPPRTGVVVIGGGIIGACTAFFLARKGVPVVLCEKGHIAGEQSSRNWGWCRKMGRDPREIPLAIEALRLWPELNALTEAETGFRRCGIVYLCKTPEEMAEREAWLEEARPYQLDTRMLSRDEAAAVLPGLSGDWQGGLYTPSDGRAEPQKAAPAIAAAAQRHGAVVLQQCAVRGIEAQGGRVSGVVTERGQSDRRSSDTRRAWIRGNAPSRVRMFGGRIDHLAHLGNLRRREAADLRVLADDVLVFRQIDAERLVGGDVALHPLDVGAELGQHGIGFRRRAAELFSLERTDRGDVTFDDVLAQGHGFLQLERSRGPSVIARSGATRQSPVQIGMGIASLRSQ